MSFSRLPFSFLSILLITVATSGQPEYYQKYCYDTGNYTTNSTYQSNLNNVLSSLSSNTNVTYGFYNISYGEEPDKVYAIAYCRGDIPLDNCSACISDSTSWILQDCPYQKEAIGWYETCTIRFSNRSIFHTMEYEPWRGLKNVNNLTSVTEFNLALQSLLYSLRNEAASGNSLRKFATGNASGPDFLTIYGLVQCTPDLSDEQCTDCVDGATRNFVYYGTVGGRVFTPSCSLRYETSRFYDKTVPLPSPPPSPTAQPATPPVLSPDSKAGKGGNNSTKIAIIAALTPVAVIALLGLGCYLYRCRKRRHRAEGESNEEILLRNLNSSSRPHWIEGESRINTGHDRSGEVHYFNLPSIQAATNNFSEENKLGQGGFGPVYKGKLPNGEEIAVKRLSMTSKQGLEEFRNEVMVIVKLQHKNLVRLLGYCWEGDEKLLVYEYLSNTSLDAFLFDPKKCKELGWAKRANIIVGIARGLLYLHEDSRLKIIHRDLKASNVLLDDEMNPKISDFGTARIFGGNQLEASTDRVVGTYGYMAPEYALEGIISIKSDVYSFGTLMLEIITGIKNRGFYNPDQAPSLLLHAWQLWNDGRGEELIDQNVVDNCPISEALRWIHIALLCVQDDPSQRPTMSLVVLMLGSQAVNLPQPSTAPFSVGRFTSLSDIFSIPETGTGFLASDQSTTSASR